MPQDEIFMSSGCHLNVTVSFLSHGFLRVNAHKKKMLIFSLQTNKQKMKKPPPLPANSFSWTPLFIV